MNEIMKAVIWQLWTEGSSIDSICRHTGLLQRAVRGYLIGRGEL